MGFNTKAFRAQDQLVGALQNITALTDWTIDYGLPSRRQELHIWVDENVENWEQEAGTTGLVTRNENFRISVYIYSRKRGASAQEIRDEIATAASTISDVVGSEPFLSGAVLYAQIVAADYGGAFADADGKIREGVLKLTIECDAFIA